MRLVALEDEAIEEGPDDGLVLALDTYAFGHVLLSRGDPLPGLARGVLAIFPPGLELHEGIGLATKRAAIDAHLVHAAVKRAVVFVSSRIVGVRRFHAIEPDDSLDVKLHAHIVLNGDFRARGSRGAGFRVHGVFGLGLYRRGGDVRACSSRSIVLRVHRVLRLGLRHRIALGIGFRGCGVLGVVFRDRIARGARFLCHRAFGDGVRAGLVGVGPRGLEGARGHEGERERGGEERAGEPLGYRYSLVGLSLGVPSNMSVHRFAPSHRLRALYGRGLYCTAFSGSSGFEK